MSTKHCVKEEPQHPTVLGEIKSDDNKTSHEIGDTLSGCVV
jgi:hypothetical protein